MPAVMPRLTPKLRRERHARLVELYLQGHSLDAIAEQVQLSLARVDRALRSEFARWQSERNAPAETVLTTELRRLLHLEATAWLAWQDSRKPQRKSLRSKRDGKSPQTSATVSESSSYGDPQLLRIVSYCIDRRCKLLGLDAPTRSLTRVSSTVAQLSEQEVDRLEEMLGLPGPRSILPAEETLHNGS